MDDSIQFTLPVFLGPVYHTLQFRLITNVDGFVSNFSTCLLKSIIYLEPLTSA